MASPEQPPRILVVDDSPAMRVAITDLLKDAGLEVTDEASNGLQAVAMVVELQPNIVIMDVRLPLLNGLEATRQITAAHPNIPVIVFSVVDNDATRQAAHQAGATAFVAKGDPPGEICSTVLATWQSTSSSSGTR